MKDRGFTLFEVIIAFIIMALILGTTFETFSTGLRQTALTDHYAGAVIRAESQLAMLDHTEPLEEGVRTGRFDQHYAWRTEITPIAQEEGEAPVEGPFRLFDVAVTVFWGDGRETRNLTLRSRRLKAQESP